VLTDAVGRFDYSGAFWDRYAPFFAACESLPDDAVVVIVGANDGVTADPTRHIWREGWRGWLVEPHPRVVTSGPGVVIKAAVAKQEGLLTLASMSESAARAYERVGANGSCLTSAHRKHIQIRLERNLSATYAKLGEQAIETFTVRCAPLAVLLAEYDAPPPDLIQIDVEGMEPEVVPQALALRPRVLLWEHQHTPGPALEQMAKKHGYQTTRLANDMLAVLPC
jgi:FkbM family methyltransferase